MRVVVALLLLALLFLVLACSSEPVVDEEDEREDATNRTYVDEEDEQEDSHTEYEPAQDVVIILPEHLDYERYERPDDHRLLVSNVQVTGKVYEKESSHELRTFINETHTFSEVRVVFVPWCNQEDKEKMFLTVNRVELPSVELVCGEKNTISVSLSLITEGFNRFTLRSFAKNDYFLEDVGLVLVKQDGREEFLEGQRLYYDRAKSTDGVLSSLQSVDHRRVYERVFRVNTDKVADDLTLEFRSSPEGELLVVVLNDYVVYEGVVERNNHVTMPRELLVNGNNKVLFVVGS